MCKAMAFGCLYYSDQYWPMVGQQCEATLASAHIMHL